MSDITLLYIPNPDKPAFRSHINFDREQLVRGLQKARNSLVTDLIDELGPEEGPERLHQIDGGDPKAEAV